MGIRATREKERSDEIDKQITEDRKRMGGDCKILVLGVPGSGKSTIVKQMRIEQENGLPESERATYRPVIHQNILDSVHTIILAMHESNTQFSTAQNALFADRILQYNLDETNSLAISSEIADVIHQFWQDSAVHQILAEEKDSLDLMDNAPYLLSDTSRIGSPDYLPSEVDVLRSYKATRDLTETKFKFGRSALSMTMIEVGQRTTERRKWIHHFESVTSVLFCIALSDYDKLPVWGTDTNRLQDSLATFESIINCRWFFRSSFLLFMNKIDLFKQKLTRVPLERHFSEYTGGNDVNKAAKFILWKFMQANRARLSVYPHLVQATATTDKNNIKLVYAAVKETILQNAVMSSNIFKNRLQEVSVTHPDDAEQRCHAFCAFGTCLLL
ncbi:Guanine nucleotide-binding protein alpha-2 subunit [Marasmius crinis-equi]|uniref:Guanine nucleotide-binding protein alpha-2 subunit n=1 Tax=Marasmius crinis-equi TaxID=585013 RepID=A0ABR3F4E1_9AGAR